jgi:hypothetical protein
MTVILANWEVETGRSWFKANSGKVCEALSQENKTQTKALGVWLKSLLCKCEVLVFPISQIK